MLNYLVAGWWEAEAGEEMKNFFASKIKTSTPGIADFLEFLGDDLIVLERDRGMFKATVRSETPFGADYSFFNEEPVVALFHCASYKFYQITDEERAKL